MSLAPCFLLEPPYFGLSERRTASSDPKIMAHNKGKYGLAAAYCAANLNNHLRARFIMAANTADVAFLLVKKLGRVVLILFGVIGIAIGLEYRTTGFSAG